jgi:hypothetical protein
MAKKFTKLGNTDEAFEAGKQAEYDAFWDDLQNHGNPANYYYAFAYNRFSDDAYDPKYPIVCSSGTTPCQALFYSNTLITDTKVEIIPSSNIAYCFYKMSNCHTIRKLTVTESTTFNNTFVGCSSLVNIEFGGTIGNNISFADSPLLSAKSIESIINALSSTASEKTVTLSQTAVNNAFTTDEWNTFIATKPNWTISLM